MNRETQNVLLLLVGGAVIKIVLDGSYIRYVQPGLRPVLLGGAALMILLAVAAIIADVRQAAQHGDGDTHDHRDRGGVYWTLLVPAAVMLFVVPPALGAESVGVSSRQPQASPAAESRFAELPPGDAPGLPMVEFVQRSSAGNSVDNRTVTLTGYALERDLDGVAGWDLARMVIGCCAADAGTIRVHLENPPAEIVRGRWFELRVRVQPGTTTEQTGYTPTVRVESATVVKEPANPYER